MSRAVNLQSRDRYKRAMVIFNPEAGLANPDVIQRKINSYLTGYQIPFQMHVTNPQEKISQFVRENNQWYYVDGKGQEPVRRESPKVGRNDPCTCGSGKKYKKCCGR